ncbi:RanBP1 domain-containing protein [Colletotrichum orchidophilum]|uniref:RanBP1 domain-containing protein n=1 Tax=Colletotrichum orchidophilum TaxID=1209926 RepID=A0A1G4ANZ9_9PEZI|nr:RanBP1 domain-containing protein [Colletotrichum orchidophilum]OHE90894.1 RanBP1 domain-containing protein [Colletotrichum orchidophilum]
MDQRNSTPRPRPSLKFANRSYQASPLNPNKRLGTPKTAPSQRVLNRDPVPSSNLNTSTISTASNLFRSSTISANSATTSFAPNLPTSTAKKVFAPGATPASQKVYRETIAQATPRGMAAKSTSAELFQMRIPSPPPELSGEALARDIPPELEAKGTVYADQYLSHLVPTEYDDLQRRQLFCVLDLRRLKYAANEIFNKKDWKLNIMNFAKEFEKSRSLIMLRYGLYEFKNVKPSEEVLKKWRTAHGLPEPEEDAADASPSRQTTRPKRKAEDQLTPKDAALSTASPNKNNKRRAMDREEPELATPATIKSTRKATVEDESEESQPSKLQKPTSTPSATKSMFEKIANNQGPSSTPKATPKAAEAKPSSLFGGASKPANNEPPRSVFEKQLKPAQASNIFGYLSDASSAKNSGVEADAESETDSDDEAEPSVAASGGAETPLGQPASSLFGAQKPLFSAGPATAPTSTLSDARETTPSGTKSLFDRVTKGNNGQPLRADSAEPVPAPEKTPFAPVKETAPAPVNATWNPNSPIKFNTNPAPSNGLFGASTNGSSSIFGAKPATPAAPASNLFGAPKQDEKPKAGKRSASEDDKGSESDKENSSQRPAKSPFGGFSGFQSKPSEAPKKDEAAPKPVAAPTFAFGAPAPKADEAKPAAQASNLFGSQDKPAGSVMQSSTLFGGSKPQETPAAEPAKPLFGASTSGTSSSFQSNPLFGAPKPPASVTSNLFGAKSSDEGSKGPQTAPAPAAAPAFSFGASKANESAGSPFGGSPMKQDGPPAKRQFNAPSSSAPAAPSGGMFNFGGSQSAAPANPFGGAAPAPQTNGGSSGPPSFGSGGGSSFTFSAGGGGQSFNNPFASANGSGSGAAPVTSAGGMFNFGGGASSAPSNGSTPFQFGGGSSAPAPAAASSTPFQFGGGAPAQPAASTPTFAFGASNGSANAQGPASQKPLFGASASAPTSNLFGAKPAQPASGGMFGNLQPPAGASTTGTNSPFNFGGASSLATTPATGTPEPAAEADKTAAAGGEGDDADGKPHEQLKLTEGGPGEEDEEILHDVRAKIMKFIPAGSEEDKDSGDDQPKNKSPWSTKGVGPLRLLKHKNTGAVRMLLRAEPRGHVVLNRTVLPAETYKADKKYVKLTTSNETGSGLETWMVQVKTEDFAKALASALETHKSANAK